MKGETEKKAKKGELTEQEIKWLLDWAVNDDRESVNLAAVKSLAASAYPNEVIGGKSYITIAFIAIPHRFVYP